MKRIENFVLPEHHNNLYREEAISSIALARDVAAKINEIVDEINELSKSNLEKTQEQDGKIRKGILYMKDNLLNTMNDLMVTLRDSGFIDDRIEYHCDSLKGRLDNLVSLVKEGTTSMDAEVIDARVGVLGEAYKSLSQAIRKQFVKRAGYGYVVYDGEPSSIFSADEKTDIVLNFPSNINVFFNNKRYVVEPCTITYSNPDTEIGLFNIVFDLDSEEIGIRYASESFTDSEIMIGWIHKNHVHMNGFGSLASFTPDSFKPKYATSWSNTEMYFTTSEDGSEYLLHVPMMFVYYANSTIVINEQTITQANENFSLYKLILDVRSKSVRLMKHNEPEEQNDVVIGFVNFASGCVELLGHSSSSFERLSPASIVIGSGGKYVEFDNAEKTITFPDDTLILTKNDSKFVQLADASGNTSISYADVGSSALKLYVDKFTKELVLKKYNEITTPNLILICSFRTSNGVVSINAPYTWNGVPYNLTEISSENYENQNIKSINHRGYNSIAPENTLSAFALSKKYGFKYVECDVSFTSDNVPVLLHDSTIDRTSNGSGSIANMTFAKVREYDFGSWKNPAYTGEKIPSFEEFILFCRNNGLHPYIEIKQGATTQNIEALCNLVKKYGMSGKVTFISFELFALFTTRTYLSNEKFGWVVNEISSSTIASIKEHGFNEIDFFIDCNVANLNSEMVQLCIDNSIPLEVWTANDESIIKNANPYVSGYTSDSIIAGTVLMN